MSRIAVVGGNGQIARHLHPQLVARGHVPVALVRREQQRAALEELGAEVRLLDIENSTAEDTAAVFEGCEAVVFSAGGGPDGDITRKRTVDLEGSCKSMKAALQTGIARFVQVSAINVDAPLLQDSSPVWRAYVEAKRDADESLRTTDLAWTIIRPGRLTDEPGTGLVSLGEQVPRAEVPRADVAAVLATVLDDERSVGQQWNLVSGEVPIDDAVAHALG